MVEVRMREHHGVDILRPHRRRCPVAQAQRLQALERPQSTRIDLPAA
jgi:hypothetical protein